MRYSENFNDATHEFTKKFTEDLLAKFPNKKWVIDAGSLQTMDAKYIPKNSILTPNKKEFEILFKEKFSVSASEKFSRQFNCIIVNKGPVTIVTSSDGTIEVSGGNPGLTKGGTGDVESGLTVALLAKNDPVLSACAGSFITKAAADELAKTKGIYFNADDLANIIPSILFSATTAVK